MTFIPVDDHLQLKDSTMTVDLYHVIANNHMADALFAYVPEHKMIIEGDIVTAAEDLQWWGDSWLDNIAYRKIEVERNVPVHMTPMTRDEVIKMVNGGIQRVKEFCAQHVAKGDYFPGCPGAGEVDAWVQTESLGALLLNVSRRRRSVSRRR